MRRLLALVLVTIGSLCAIAGVAVAQPTPGAPIVIDGPSADIQGLGGMSVARDGSGGVVYLKNVSGVPRVFVSRLLGGVFQPPEQIDANLGAGSSQPVIAAGNGGLLLIAFVNGGVLYVVDRPTPASSYSAPLAVLAGAANPALAITNLGKAYLAFTVAGAAGHDVRAAYYYLGRWALESPPLDAAPGEDSGTGTGRPQVAAAGDGVGIVVFGEGGHVYSRRIWGTSPSIVFEQADVASLGGWNEVSADEPSVAAGGDSSYAQVAFRELLASGSSQQSRVLTNRLHGSVYDGISQPDGLSTPGTDSGDQPQVAMGEYGHGFVTSARAGSGAVFAMSLGDNGASGPVTRVDTLQSASLPYAVPVTAGLSSLLIAWQRDPGLTGAPEIRARYAASNQNLGPEMVLSAPGQGPTEAASGLVAGGDVDGDAAVAWVQGTGAATQVVADQLYQPPGAIGIPESFEYVRTAQPVLSWNPARERWGPLTYNVSIDGVSVAHTTGTSVTAPQQLSNGPHTWEVTGVNPAGLSTATGSETVFVDTVPPIVSLALMGKLQAGSYLHLVATYTDAPPPLPAADASGVSAVSVNWGDGSVYQITRGKYHAYRRAGHYRLTVTVTDRAGNTTTLVRTIKIAPVPRKRSRPKKGTGGVPVRH